VTYALIIPPELLAELVAIRSATGMSIRKQILHATEEWIQECRHSGPAAHALITNKEVRP
jgi:hypothetical protein